MKKIVLSILMLVYCLQVKCQVFGVIGDAGHWNKNSKLVRDSMISQEVFNLIMPGDNLYDTSLEYDDVWKHWEEKGFKFDVVSLGNHFLSIEEELNFFQMPSKFFFKDFQDVRFIILDSETLDVLDQQASFLEDALKTSSKKFNIIVYHHPMASVSYRHGWREREAFHLKMRPIIQRWSTKINLIINGHDHIASLFTYDSIPVLISGAVFESIPTDAFSYQQENGGYVLTRWVNKKGFYWVRLELFASKNMLELQFVRVDHHEVSCKMRIKAKQLIRHSNCFKNGNVGDVYY